MSTKLQKVCKEIEKAEQTISQWQDKLKTLHKEKVDLENLQMIDFLRKKKVNHNDLRKAIDTYHDEHGASVPLKIESTERGKY